MKYRLIVSLILLLSCWRVLYADELRLLTWNIYFNDDSAEQRYPEILKYLARSEADVICLQEVTSLFRRYFMRSDLAKHYQIANTRTGSFYTSATLLRSATNKSSQLTMPTRMQRAALVSEYMVGSDAVEIVNLHLDSMMDDTGLRINQLSFVLSKIDLAKNRVLCGDFNFGDGEKENAILKNDFVDTGKEDARPTYDVGNNRLASKTRFINEPSRRLDRVFVSRNIASRRYRMDKIEWSDHYPVQVVLELKNRTGN